MKSINKLEIGKEFAESIMVITLCISFCIVVKYIDMKKSYTVQSIEERLESIEKDLRNIQDSVNGQTSRLITKETPTFVGTKDEH